MFREQDLILREREKEHERRESSKKNTPLNSPRSSDDPSRNSNRPVDVMHTLHRPFEQKPPSLTNGYEHNHLSDFERRRMTEHILAQDRMLAQDRAASSHEGLHVESRSQPQERPSSGHDKTMQNCKPIHDPTHHEWHSSRQERASSHDRNMSAPDRPTSGHDIPDRLAYNASLSRDNNKLSSDKQTEGMHARLMEVKKVHGSPASEDKTHRPGFLKLNQYDYDRPHPQLKYKMSTGYNSVYDQHTDSKDDVNDMSMLSSSNLSSRTQEAVDSSHTLGTDSQRVTSKLDKEEHRILKARSSGMYNSDMSDNDLEDDDEDERRVHRCLMIASGPAIKLEAPPEKLKFFKNFDLTTQDKKRGRVYFLTLMV